MGSSTGCTGLIKRGVVGVVDVFVCNYERIRIIPIRDTDAVVDAIKIFTKIMCDCKILLWVSGLWVINKILLIQSETEFNSDFISSTGVLVC